MIEAHGIFTYESASQQYVLYWVDTMGMPMLTYRGSLENGILTRATPLPNGSVKATRDLRTSDTYTFKMEVPPDGANWKTMLESAYRKSA